VEEVIPRRGRGDAGSGGDGGNEVVGRGNQVENQFFRPGSPTIMFVATDFSMSVLCRLITLFLYLPSIRGSQPQQPIRAQDSV
jgi:hypothetical protein